LKLTFSLSDDAG
jgi:hypothetical protein